MRSYRKWVLSLGLAAAVAPSLALAGPFSQKPVGAQAASAGNNQQTAESVAQALRAAKLAGFDIDVDRVFYKGGAEVKRETITTKYRPAPKVVCKKKKNNGDANAGMPSPGATPAPSGPVQPTPDATVPGEAAPNPGQG